jgi:hypothetical protein
MKETSKYKNKKNQSKKEQESFRKKFFFSNFQRTVSNIANAAVGAGVLAIPYVSLKKKFSHFFRHSNVLVYLEDLEFYA